MRIHPKCQGLARAQWLVDRQSELLPAPYFHLVFTVPTAVAYIALQNKAVVYDLLFPAVAETVQTVSADRKHLGAAIGMTAVLHTLGQNRFHHPHVDCIVLGGGCPPRSAGSPAGTGSSLQSGSFPPLPPVRAVSRLERPAVADNEPGGPAGELTAGQVPVLVP